MRNSSRFFLLGAAALLSISGARADEMVGLSTDNLLRNGTFAGPDGWMATGEGISTNCESGARIKLVAPREGASPTRQFAQLVPSAIGRGRTLYLRFRAWGTVKLGIQLREANDWNQKLIATSIAQPGDDVTGGPKLYSYAVKAPRDYGAEELQIAFSFGAKSGDIVIKNVELLDQGNTPLTALTQTDIATRPQTIAPAPQPAEPLPELKPVAAPKPAVTNDVVLKQQPINSAPVSLVFNGDFAKGDAGWNAWGKNVTAQLKDGWLQMDLAKMDAPKNASGISQTINTPVAKGEKIVVQLKAKGVAKFAVALHETNNSNVLLSGDGTANNDGSDQTFSARADRDYPAGALQFEIQFGQGVGQLDLSSLRVSKRAGDDTASPSFSFGSQGSQSATPSVVPVVAVSTSGKIEPKARFGTPGISNSTFECATDGDPKTTFDSADGTGSYAGFDAGATVSVAKLRFQPRGWLTKRMIGGQFQVAASQDGPWTTFYTIPSEPKAFGWNEAAVSTKGRFFRYLGPAEGHSNIGEFELFAGN